MTMARQIPTIIGGPCGESINFKMLNMLCATRKELSVSPAARHLRLSVERRRSSFQPMEGGGRAHLDTVPECSDIGAPICNRLFAEVYCSEKTRVKPTARRRSGNCAVPGEK